MYHLISDVMKLISPHRMDLIKRSSGNTQRSQTPEYRGKLNERRGWGGGGGGCRIEQ